MPTWISLGAFADLDPTEGNFLSENAASLLGTYDNGDMSFVTAVSNDADGDGLIRENDVGGGESVTVDGVTSAFDSVQSYMATITEGDGTTLTTSVGVVQLANGQAYLVPSDEFDLDNRNIQTIQLTSVQTDSYDGMYATSAARSIDNASVVCFAQGTMIDTRQGARAVETLSPSDLLRTLDHGWQPLRWVGSTHLRTGNRTRPVRIARHALGTGYPARDLLVSPQHRILVRSRIADRMFGSAEVLVAAKKLVGLAGITTASEVSEVTYWHLLCDAHEIIYANGALAESFYTGPMAMAALDPTARAEIRKIHPQLADPDYAPSPARPFVKGGPLRTLLARHAKNRKPLVHPCGIDGCSAPVSAGGRPHNSHPPNAAFRAH